MNTLLQSNLWVAYWAHPFPQGSSLQSDCGTAGSCSHWNRGGSAFDFHDIRMMLSLGNHGVWSSMKPSGQFLSISWDNNCLISRLHRWKRTSVFYIKSVWNVFTNASSITWFFFLVLSTQHSEVQEFKIQISNKTEFESTLMVDIQLFA